MKNLVVVMCAIFALVGCQPQPREELSVSTPPSSAVAEPSYWPMAGWKSSTPEQQAMDSARLAEMFDAIDLQQLNMHSVLIIRNGYIVTEAYFAPYAEGVKHQIASVTKSVAGMLTGIAIDQGRIESIQQPVLSFFPGRTVANVNRNKKNLTLESLLSLTAGFDCNDGAGTRDQMFQSPDWVQFSLDLPMASAPGERFSYCSPAVHLISPILNQATGRSIRELANESLFAPLGIQPAGAADWDVDPQGVAQGFGGLALKPRDMAKLGFLYLHGGRWNDRQIVPDSWVASSLSPHAADETGRGYGYLFWIYGSRGYYSAMGLGGQDIHIIPSKNMVVVFTAAMDIPTHDKEAIKLLDDFIVPAATGTEPLPENPTALAQLQERIRRATAPQVAAPPLPDLARSISGKVYQLDANPFGWNTISLTFSEGSAEALATLNSSHQLLIGLDNVYRMTRGDGIAEAARGHWEGGEAFVVDDHLVGAVMQWQFHVTFPGDQVLVEFSEQITARSGSVRGALASARRAD